MSLRTDLIPNTEVQIDPAAIERIKKEAKVGVFFDLRYEIFARLGATLRGQSPQMKGKSISVAFVNDFLNLFWGKVDTRGAIHVQDDILPEVKDLLRLIGFGNLDQLTSVKPTEEFVEGIQRLDFEYHGKLVDADRARRRGETVSAASLQEIQNLKQRLDTSLESIKQVSTYFFDLCQGTVLPKNFLDPYIQNPKTGPRDVRVKYPSSADDQLSDGARGHHLIKNRKNDQDVTINAFAIEIPPLVRLKSQVEDANAQDARATYEKKQQMHQQMRQQGKDIDIDDIKLEPITSETEQANKENCAQMNAALDHLYNNAQCIVALTDFDTKMNPDLVDYRNLTENLVFTWDPNQTLALPYLNYTTRIIPAESSHLPRLELANLTTKEKREIEFLNIKMVDMAAFQVTPELLQAVDIILSSKKPINIAVHCASSVGRTGMFLFMLKMLTNKNIVEDIKKLSACTNPAEKNELIERLKNAMRNELFSLRTIRYCIQGDHQFDAAIDFAVAFVKMKLEKSLQIQAMVAMLNRDLPTGVNGDKFEIYHNLRRTFPVMDTLVGAMERHKKIESAKKGENEVSQETEINRHTKVNEEAKDESIKVMHEIESRYGIVARRLLSCLYVEAKFTAVSDNDNGFSAYLAEAQAFANQITQDKAYQTDIGRLDRINKKLDVLATTLKNPSPEHALARGIQDLIKGLLRLGTDSLESQLKYFKMLKKNLTVIVNFMEYVTNVLELKPKDKSMLPSTNLATLIERLCGRYEGMVDIFKDKPAGTTPPGVMTKPDDHIEKIAELVTSIQSLDNSLRERQAIMAQSRTGSFLNSIHSKVGAASENLTNEYLKQAAQIKDEPSYRPQFKH